LAYPAKRDWWVACLVVPGSLSLVSIGAVIAYQVVTQAMPPGPGLLVAAVAAAIGGLLLWMFSGTSYEIGDTHLITRLGPFRFRVPLDAIGEAVSTTGFRVVIGLGLAWSLDMVHVKYRKASGRRAFPVSISPQDKSEFLRELAGAVAATTVTPAHVPCLARSTLMRCRCHHPFFAATPSSFSFSTTRVAWRTKAISSSISLTRSAVATVAGT
jgi:hypothetical protein